MIAKGHDLRYAINNNKIKKTLGFRSKYKFEKALDTTVKWYLNNSDWLKIKLNESINSWIKRAIR